MTKIKFGTDGWRAIIAKEYTVDNLKRVAKATAVWLNKNFDEPSAVIGNDCRFGGEMFTDVCTRILAEAGVKVYKASNKFVSTPMISLATTRYGASAGIVITASHNPPSYNGFKIKASFGGPALPNDIAEVESYIEDIVPADAKSHDFYAKKGLIEMADLEELYMKEVEAHFDLAAIRESEMVLAYDPMYGAGQNVIRRLFPEAIMIHDDYNPSFKGTPPEPIMKNLHDLSNRISSHSDVHIGLATDGDADRIGLMDSDGEFVDSHHILVLLIHYLHKVKGLHGKVVVSFSCTRRIRKMCEAYGLPLEITKIGFKYICGIMVSDDVLVGGEESGGIAIKGYIPERDGIWIGLTLMEYMAKSGKSLKELIEEVYKITGPFANHRNDLHIEESQKQEIIQKCKDRAFTAFGSYEIRDVEDVDGYKFLFDNDENVMIRPSGTEPVLRVYAESDTLAGAEKILEEVKKSIL